MSDPVSSVLELLSSIRKEWIYADILIARIESGAVSENELRDIAELIQESLQQMENSEIALRMKNIVFQISLIHLEEKEVRKGYISEALQYIQREL